MSEIVFLLEEQSARVLLESLLPRLLPHTYLCRYVVFDGKQDLQKNLLVKLRGWRDHGTHFIVLHDQDANNCLTLKHELERICHVAKKQHTIVRIVCRELESWYLGDLVAVERGLSLSGIVERQFKQRYRNPDILDKPSFELRKLTKNKYQKISGSRAIAPHLSLDSNKSHSFNVFIKTLRNIIAHTTEKSHDPNY